MRVYFACSITGGRAFESVYQALTGALLDDKHEVPTAHLAQSNVVVLENSVDAQEVYKRDIDWICACDALVAEVSIPSHGVGYEIGYALGAGKPVLCLAENGRAVSKMITGNSHPKLMVKYYQDAFEGIQIMRTFLAGLAYS